MDGADMIGVLFVARNPAYTTFLMQGRLFYKIFQNGSVGWNVDAR